jgi:mannose-1-phosphate guanylyltransferase
MAPTRLSAYGATLAPHRRVPSKKESRWAIILAGGEGVRLRELTRRIAGDDRPKQFCPLLGHETLLEQTVGRVGQLIPRAQTLVVLLRAHQPYYAPLLSGLPPECLVVQPHNRGTAPAILYGLLRLGTLDLAGPGAILPSDHYVSDDGLFMAHIDRAFEIVRVRPDLIVLLGVVPESPEPEYGWIEPGDELAGPWTGPLRRVSRFWEKPHPGTASLLMARGCLWNSFVLIAYPYTLATLVRHTLPTLADDFSGIQPRLTTPWETDSVRRLYSRLASTDFSKHVLASRPANLAVLTLDGVGWSDLGRPGRVLAALDRCGGRPQWAARAS